MNSYKINFTQNIHEKSIESRIGGFSLLPEDVEWPKNPRGEKLVLIASISSKMINELVGTNYPDDTILSVFSTYNEEYFLDVITYHGSKEELKNIKSGFTRVILHKTGSGRSEAHYYISARKIELVEKTDEQNYTASKIGGMPGLLQNEPLNIGNKLFCLQLYSADFPEGCDDIFYLSDAVGYLFISVDANYNDSGMFFVQTS